MLYFPNKRPKREANDLQQLSKRMQHLESYMWIHVVNHVQTTPGQNTLASHHDSTLRISTMAQCGCRLHSPVI